jgi:hypothetical protein
LWWQVYIWTRNTSEDWSAFAPNFTVLEENEEYVEREDEVSLNTLLASVSAAHLEARSLTIPS